MKIDTIIWSFNRPLQLNLLLRSTEKFFANSGKIFILYKYSNDIFKLGYDKLITKKFNLEIEWIEEKNFNLDIRDILKNKIKTPNFLGNSDDNIFIDYVRLDDNFKIEDDEIGFSLRLGNQINICQPAHNLSLTLPTFIKEKENELKWDWTLSNEKGCWGYPTPCDSTIFLKDYIYTLIKDVNFINPATLEVYMNHNRNFNKPFMRSFKNTKLISIVANTVYANGNNPNSGISVEYLNHQWLNNKIIELPDIKNNNACHIEYAYSLKNNK